MPEESPALPPFEQLSTMPEKDLVGPYKPLLEVE
jgi:hypothetical protein